MEPTELEKLLKNHGQSAEDQARFLTALASSKVFVVMDRPWGKKLLPDREARLLFVTDGADHERGMLALFTSEELAVQFQAETPGFSHPIEVDAAWAFLSIPDGCGAILNPNDDPHFRVGPEAAGIISEDVRNALIRLQEKREADKTETAAPGNGPEAG